MLTVDMQKILEDQFLGKRVIVKTKDGEFGGICTFIGENEYFPSWGLQVTVGRCPLNNVLIKNIKLI